VGQERGQLSLVSTIEELPGRNSNGSGLEILEYGRRDPSRWSNGTFYQQKSALSSLTSGGRWRTQATEFVSVLKQQKLTVVAIAPTGWLCLQLLNSCTFCLSVHHLVEFQTLTHIWILHYSNRQLFALIIFFSATMNNITRIIKIKKHTDCLVTNDVIRTTKVTLRLTHWPSTWCTRNPGGTRKHLTGYVTLRKIFRDTLFWM
jgi:hypothetical protein